MPSQNTSTHTIINHPNLQSQTKTPPREREREFKKRTKKKKIKMPKVTDRSRTKAQNLRSLWHTHTRKARKRERVWLRLGFWGKWRCEDVDCLLVFSYAAFRKRQRRVVVWKEIQEPKFFPLSLSLSREKSRKEKSKSTVDAEVCVSVSIYSFLCEDETTPVDTRELWFSFFFPQLPLSPSYVLPFTIFFFFFIDT
jgi:hypothetical protein